MGATKRGILESTYIFTIMLMKFTYCKSAQNKIYSRDFNFHAGVTNLTNVTAIRILGLVPQSKIWNIKFRCIVSSLIQSGNMDYKQEYGEELKIFRSLVFQAHA